MAKRKTPTWQYVAVAAAAATAVGGIAYAVTRDEDEGPTIGGFERTEEIEGVNIGTGSDYAGILRQYWDMR